MAKKAEKEEKAVKEKAEKPAAKEKAAEKAIEEKHSHKAEAEKAEKEEHKGHEKKEGHKGQEKPQEKQPHEKEGHKGHEAHEKRAEEKEEHKKEHAEGHEKQVHEKEKPVHGEIGKEGEPGEEAEERHERKEKPKKGKKRARAVFVELPPAEIIETIVHLANEGKSASEMGMILRDQHGILNVEKALGKKIGAILREKEMLPKIPEDMMALIKKSVSLGEHLAKNKKDMSAKRGLMLTISKIRALEHYYKKKGRLPLHWRYSAETASLLAK